jgi:actin-related protein 2
VVDKEYKLPDGTKIIIGRERFEAPECLFSPYLIDDEKPGVADMIF